MARQMVRLGRLQVATPETMAMSIRNPTPAQDAVDERVEGPARAAAQEALASDPTVAAAGVAAVQTAVAGLNVVQAQALPVDATAEIGIAVPFEDGSRTALEVDRKGRPTALSAALHVEAEHLLMGVAVGVEERTDVALPDAAAVFVYEDGSIAGTIGRNGAITFATPAPTAFVAHGDSTTYGADLNDPVTERWTTMLGTRLGITIDNHGLSGARAEEIAAFSGGITITGTVDGGSIPASGNASIQASGLNIDPWRAGMGPVLGPSYPAVVLADDGTRVEGTFKYQTNLIRYFTRTIPGAAIPTGKIEIRAAIDRRPFLFLGMGTNNEPTIADGSQTLADVLTWYRDITTRWQGDYLVWGLLDRGYNERPGTVTGDLITALEARLGDMYGDRFLNVRRYLASQQALTDAVIFNPAFTPTSDDTIAVGVGRIPPSFRFNYGSVHLNALGHQLQARLIHRYMRLRGIAA